MSATPPVRQKRTGRRKILGLLLVLLLGPPALGLTVAFTQTVSRTLPLAEPLVSEPDVEIVSLHQLIRRGQWAEADRLAGDLAARFAENAFFQYLSGVLRWQHGDKIAAIQSFRRSEKLGLNTAYLHKGLGLAYFEINQFKLFQRQMEAAMTLDPKDPEPLFHLGRYFESVVDDCGMGLTYFQRAAALDRRARNLYFQGHCLEVLSRHDEARESYQAAVEVLAGTGEIFGWPFQGMARLSLDSNAVQAVAWAEKAVRMEPGVPENHFVLAKAYREVESTNKAVAALQTAIRLNPQYASAYYMLFSLHSKLGRQEEARAALETFNKLKSVYATY